MRKKKELKYQQIFNAMLADINSGKLQPQEQLLPEEKLAEKYNVSRVTVRAALDALEELGYITRFRGRGTFVRKKVMEKRVENVVSFTESSLMAGNTPGGRVMDICLIKAPLMLINYLGISEEDEVWAVKRVRTINNLTVLYEESYWVDKICGRISVEEAQNSILGALEARGIKAHFGKQEFVAIGASANVAKNLEVPESFPILRSTMAFFTKEDQPMFLSVTYYRTDRITVTSARYL